MFFVLYDFYSKTFFAVQSSGCEEASGITYSSITRGKAPDRHLGVGMVFAEMSRKHTFDMSQSRGSLLLLPLVQKGLSQIRLPKGQGRVRS